jgi:formylglycine-generating enzyme required for sulfatase activity/3',5'-cyclic AMP phosphodiesterase CpdA
MLNKKWRKIMKLNFLHLSDLHLTGDKKTKAVTSFNQDIVLCSMLTKIEELKNNKNDFDFIVITGDIAFSGQSEDYQVAKVFCEKLLEITKLTRNRLFIVPGNHDINRVNFKKQLCFFNTQDDISGSLKDKDTLPLLLKKFDEFNTFANETMDRYYYDNKTYHYTDTLVLEKNDTHVKINLIGLNSGLFGGYHNDDKEKLALSLLQVDSCIKKLDKEGIINIALFHHPFECFHEKDKVAHKTLKRKVDFILNGHLHKPDTAFNHDSNGKYIIINTGACFKTRTSENRFGRIEVDLNTGCGKVQFYKYIHEDNIWIEDKERNPEEKDGHLSFDIKINKEKLIKKIETIIEDISPDELKKLSSIFKKYKTYALNEHRFLPMKGFETNLRTNIEIEQIYINMRAHLQSYDFDITVAGKRKWEQKIKEEQIASLDIKKAFQVSVKRKIKDMVILGDPGSGKTTLLKYILVMLLEGKAREKLGLDSDIIPFFAPLRELRKPDSEDFLSFMKRVCLLNKHKISDNDCQKLLDHKKGIVLLDGLDEVADEKTRIKVCKWIDSARKEFVNTQFIVTSRFAGYLGKSRLEGAVMELSIQDFTSDEVKAFLIRWFETVEAALHPGDETDVWKDKGRKDALELYENIDGSPHLKKLAVNPLILQIIALIRRDRGTALPQRRVELYQECVNVLLEKWDMAKGLDVLISAREARQILQPLALWLHQKDERRSASLIEIKKIIQEPLEELGKSDTDPEKLLLNIRDRSGIFMGYSESEYGFAHLSFQEYLAAEEVRNTDQIEILIKNYNKKWWREVILLSLGLDNPSIIKPFMEQIIETKHFKTNIGIITDAIDDSLKKPAGPFIDALKSKEFDSDVLQNVIRILTHIGGRSVISALKEAVKSKEKVLAQAAFAALKALKAVKGVKEPFIETVPAVIKHEKDDSEMVLVPAGKFLYGSREDDKLADSDEKPQRTIHLPDFYIDVYPVTNRQYCRFLNEMKPSDKNLDKWIYLKGKFENEKCRILQKGNGYDIETDYENYPVIYMTWHGAKAYADWAGKRLPTEQEWEKAANSRESGIKHTTEAGRYPKGKSPYGCYDMSGNVWEWTGSYYDSNKDTYVLRGGSWSSGSNYCRCAFRLSYDLPDIRFSDGGFRCART